MSAPACTDVDFSRGVRTVIIVVVDHGPKSFRCPNTDCDVRNATRFARDENAVSDRLTRRPIVIFIVVLRSRVLPCVRDAFSVCRGYRGRISYTFYEPPWRIPDFVARTTTVRGTRFIDAAVVSTR